MSQRYMVSCLSNWNAFQCHDAIDWRKIDYWVLPKVLECSRASIIIQQTAGYILVSCHI